MSPQRIRGGQTRKRISGVELRRWAEVLDSHPYRCNPSVATGIGRRAIGYPKIHTRVPTVEAQELLEILGRSTTHFQDPDKAPDVRSSDPDDDYLIALAAESRSVLVSDDSELLGLSGQIPVRSPIEFLAMIERPGSNRTQ